MFHTGRSSTASILVDLSDREVGPRRDAGPAGDLAVVVREHARWDLAAAEPLHVLAPRPARERLVRESTRWLRHQHTLASGFLFGPSMVATSAKRVAGPHLDGQPE